MNDRRLGPGLATIGAILAVVALWVPWFAIDGVGAERNGFAFATGVGGVTLIVAAVVTALAPKRRQVLHPRGPLTLGLVFSAIATLMIINRAVIAPGPESASVHIETRPGLWLVVVGAIVTTIGLALARQQLSGTVSSVADPQRSSDAPG